MSPMAPDSLPHERPSQTKIVATLGPACAKPQTLQKLIKAGADVFRINTAHGSEAEHQAMADAVRQASDALGQPVGILADLPGPKIRLGELADGDDVNDDGEFQCVAVRTKLMLIKSMPARAAQVAFFKSTWPRVGTLSLTPGRLTPWRLRTGPPWVIVQVALSASTLSTRRAMVPSTSMTLSPGCSSSMSGS